MKLKKDKIETLCKQLKVSDPAGVIEDACEMMTLKVVMFIQSHVKQLIDTKSSIPLEHVTQRSQLSTEIMSLNRVCVLISEAE